MTRPGYNHDEVQALADTRYVDAETPEDRLFLFLIDVADAYVVMLEEQAADHPAPYLMGTTPTECALNGLSDHLEILREGGREQLR